MKRLAAFVLTLLLALTLCACSREADISSYGDSPIVISGLTDEEFTVTPNELLRLECVSRTATGRSEKAGTVNAKGPLLNTFLAQYGKSASDFQKIRFIAKDDYKVVLKGEYLIDYEIVLAVSNGDKPLDKDQQPLRVLIPEAESSMWEYSVVRIEFVYDK